jgi:hypothetical protein
MRKIAERAVFKKRQILILTWERSLNYEAMAKRIRVTDATLPKNLRSLTLMYPHHAVKTKPQGI